MTNTMHDSLKESHNILLTYLQTLSFDFSEDILFLILMTNVIKEFVIKEKYKFSVMVG